MFCATRSSRRVISKSAAPARGGPKSNGKEADAKIQQRAYWFTECTAPAHLTIDWTRDRRGAALARGLAPERPPPFAVDLLEARIPIEMGCQGRAHSPSKDGRLSTLDARAACGGRDP
jgi:hypothetical protein